MAARNAKRIIMTLGDSKFTKVVFFRDLSPYVLR